MLVTRMYSAGSTGSPMWNWVGGIAELLAAGNDAEEVIVQVSVVPADGAVVPLLLVAVVDGLLADIVTGVVIGYAAQLMVAMMLGPPQAIANVPATVVYPVPPNQMPAIRAAGLCAAAYRYAP